MKNTEMEKNIGPCQPMTNGNGGNKSRARQHTVLHFNKFFISSDSAHSKYVLPFGAFSDLEAPFTHKTTFSCTTLLLYLFNGLFSRTTLVSSHHISPFIL